MEQARRRILIVGSGGAGKSTLARRLGAATSLPVIHLDREHWLPGWTVRPRETWQARVQELAGGDRWIIDGNYPGTMARCAARCDTFVLFDPPRLACVWGVLKRQTLQRNNPRHDLPEGCVDAFTWGFLKEIWFYRRDVLPRTLAVIDGLPPDVDLVVLRSRRDAARFVASMTGSAQQPTG